MKRILIVDDSVTVRQQVAEALSAAGFETVMAQDGLEAISCIEGQDVSAMVLDVNMPRLGGLELLEKLKELGKLPGLPVLMLTTEAQKATIERAKKAGARGWIVKPVKMDTLVGVVNKLVASAGAS